MAAFDSLSQGDLHHCLRIPKKKFNIHHLHIPNDTDICILQDDWCRFLCLNKEHRCTHPHPKNSHCLGNPLDSHIYKHQCCSNNFHCSCMAYAGTHPSLCHKIFLFFFWIKNRETDLKYNSQELSLLINNNNINMSYLAFSWN